MRILVAEDDAVLSAAPEPEVAEAAEPGLPSLLLSARSEPALRALADHADRAQGRQ